MNATAAHILRLVPRLNTERPAGALPAGVEYQGPHGMINYFLWGVPAPALLQQPEVAALAGGLQSVKLLQSEEDGSWQLSMHGTNMDIPALTFPMEAEQVFAVLAANGITLPGLAPAGPAAPAAPAGQEDPNAPPF